MASCRTWIVGLTGSRRVVTSLLLASVVLVTACLSMEEDSEAERISALEGSGSDGSDGSDGSGGDPDDPVDDGGGGGSGSAAECSGEPSSGGGYGSGVEPTWSVPEGGTVSEGGTATYTTKGTHETVRQESEDDMSGPLSERNVYDLVETWKCASGSWTYVRLDGSINSATRLVLSLIDPYEADGRDRTRTRTTTSSTTVTNSEWVPGISTETLDEKSKQGTGDQVSVAVTAASWTTTPLFKNNFGGWSFSRTGTKSLEETTGTPGAEPIRKTTHLETYTGPPGPTRVETTLVSRRVENACTTYLHTTRKVDDTLYQAPTPVRPGYLFEKQTTREKREWTDRVAEPCEMKFFRVWENYEDRGSAHEHRKIRDRTTEYSGRGGPPEWERFNYNSTRKEGAYDPDPDRTYFATYAGHIEGTPYTFSASWGEPSSTVSIYYDRTGEVERATWGDSSNPTTVLAPLTPADAAAVAAARDDAKQREAALAAEVF